MERREQLPVSVHMNTIIEKITGLRELCSGEIVSSLLACSSSASSSTAREQRNKKKAARSAEGEYLFDGEERSGKLTSGR